MDYWPNQENNRHEGSIRKKQDRGTLISLKFEVDPRQYGCHMPVIDIWASCYGTTLSGTSGKCLIYFWYFFMLLLLFPSKKSKIFESF